MLGIIAKNLPVALDGLFVFLETQQCLAPVDVCLGVLGFKPQDQITISDGLIKPPELVVSLQDKENFITGMFSEQYNYFEFIWYMWLLWGAQGEGPKGQNFANFKLLSPDPV